MFDYIIDAEKSWRSFFKGFLFLLLRASARVSFCDDGIYVFYSSYKLNTPSLNSFLLFLLLLIIDSPY